MSRRSNRISIATTVAAAIGWGASSAMASAGAEQRVIASPNGKVQFAYAVQDEQLAFTVKFAGRQVVAASPVTFLLDGEVMTSHVQREGEQRYVVDERYPCLGVHAEAVNRCQGATIQLRHLPTSQRTILEVRVYDDGVAYRHLAPGGDDSVRVPDEATRFTAPEGCRAWFHDLESHYEGVYQPHDVDDIPAGAWLAPPATFQLPAGAGYLAVTEAALEDYSGMALRADGANTFHIVLGHAHDASYPFRLRYPGDVQRLQKPAPAAGDVVTPWRVFIVSGDLNGLVNSDIVQNCCPPPDPKLFPAGAATRWIKPGRAVWRYLDGGENTLEEVRRFSEAAGRLGFEYQVVEGFWRDWSEDQIAEAVEFSKKQGVGLWFWEHSRNLRTAAARQEFFARLNRLGVVGAKIDFFDHEHREIVDLYPALLAEAARRQILVNFHGANKPTGGQRTWPNELIREGVRGAEHRRPADRAAHNAALPFTRYLAGPGDYTPVLFSDRRGDTTWAHQLAAAVVLTQPLLTYAAHPQTLLKSPAVDLIRNISSVWDETIVLPGSAVGQCVAMARRRGDRWFVAALNGTGERRTLQVPLNFLGPSQFDLASVADNLQDPASLLRDDRSVRRDERLAVVMTSGGGFVAMLTPSSPSPGLSDEVDRKDASPNAGARRTARR